MATWKKIITSGSKAHLQEVTGSTGVLGTRIQSTDLTATRIVFAGTNGVLTDDSDLTFSTDTLTATKIGAFEAAGAINFSNQAMTNVDINSGAIDNTVIGGNTAVAGTFTHITASAGISASSLTVNGIGGKISSSVAGTGSFGHLMVGGTNYTSTQLDSAIAANAVTALNNATENELVTVGSTTTELDAESALTFTGTTLSIVGNGAKVQFYDSGDEHISADNAGVLSINAGTEVDITATTVDINGAVDISGNTVIGGDLTVNGTTTTIESINIAVSESLMFLASGSSAANVDAGILVQSGSVVGSGSALYHDTNDERWAVAKGIAQDASTISPNRFVTTVKVSTASPSGTEYGVGEMWVDTNENDGAGNGTIYILTEE